MNQNNRILILGDVNSIHIHKWVLGLNDDYHIGIFSTDALKKENSWLLTTKNVSVFANTENTSNTNNLLSYFKIFKNLKRVYKEFNPTITHAHYATSYGLLGALLKPTNYFISLWGTDTYLFPKKSFLHKLLFKYILSKATKLFATSENLKQEGQKYTGKNIDVIPFGIDTNKFVPIENKANEIFTVGTVKGLNALYGIDILIKAFTSFHKKHPNSQCLIYGEGIEKDSLIQLISDLKMGNHIFLKGFVKNDDVPKILNTFDVYCALSRSESFGVAVIEASSCELPVIVSNVGGLPEVVQDDKTGFIVDIADIEQIACKIEALYLNSNMRKEMGLQGRAFVKKHYTWETNVNQQKEEYNKYLYIKNL